MTSRTGGAEFQRYIPFFRDANQCNRWVNAPHGALHHGAAFVNDEMEAGMFLN